MNEVDLKGMKRTCDAHQRAAHDSFTRAARKISMPADLIEQFWKMAHDAGKSEGVYESTKGFYEGMVMANGKVAVALAAKESGVN